MTRSSGTKHKVILLVPFEYHPKTQRDANEPNNNISLRIAEDQDIQRFLGNQTDSDHFKLLEQDGDSLLVGARNIVYNISLLTLEENKRLQWYSTDDEIRTCKYKGKSDEYCQNYIRVLAKKADNGIFVCGTNAFKPKCRHYLENVRHVSPLLDNAFDIAFHFCQFS